MKAERRPTDEEKLAAIRDFVVKRRKKLKIKNLNGPLPELSCFAHGEFNNLLWRTLMYVPEEQWTALKDREVLDGVYREVIWKPKGAA